MNQREGVFESEGGEEEGGREGVFESGRRGSESDEKKVLESIAALLLCQKVTTEIQCPHLSLTSYSGKLLCYQC